MPGCTHLPVLNSAPTRTRPRIWDAPAPIGLWHLTSLDAPTVSLVWSWGFTWAAGVRLRAWAPIALALITWAIYIADRLLDARAGMQFPPLHLLRERHLFHWRYRRVLAPLGIFSAATAALLVLARLPSAARLPDTALAAATLAYFSGVHSRGGLSSRLHRLLSPLSSKAVLVGAFFTAGCLLPVASQLSRAGAAPAMRALALPALFFACLAWLNCRLIGRWESRSADTTPVPRPRDSLLSRERAIDQAGSTLGGNVRRPACAWLIAISGAFLALSLANPEPRAAILIDAGAAGACLLGLLDSLSDRLTPLALRATADLVLLTPALLFFLRT